MSSYGFPRMHQQHANNKGLSALIWRLCVNILLFGSDHPAWYITLSVITLHLSHSHFDVWLQVDNIMPNYGLFWTWSPYLDLRWRSRSTGNIPELLITSIVQHNNKNRWVGDLLWRSCSLFCLVIFHSSFGLVKYPYTKQFTWSPQGIPLHLFLLYYLNLQLP